MCEGSLHTSGCLSAGGGGQCCPRLCADIRAARWYLAVPDVPSVDLRSEYDDQRDHDLPGCWKGAV